MLLGRFAPIFYLNCEHVFFVYILKLRRKKFCGIKKKNSRIFKNLIFLQFTKLKTFKKHFLKFLSFLNLSCGHVMSHKKIGPYRFSRFDVYWIQTNKQTDKRPDKPNSYLDRYCYNFDNNKRSFGPKILIIVFLFLYMQKRVMRSLCIL